MAQPAKLATPLAALAGLLVHVSAAPDVPLPSVIARVTALVLVVTVLPPASWMVILGWVPNAVPPVEFEGCWLKTSFAAGPTEMLNELVVAEVNPADDAVRVYPVPGLLMDRLLNVATPATAVCGCVPESVPEPGLLPIAMSTDARLLVWLPN